MSDDHPTLSEIGEQNIRAYLKRKQRIEHEEDYDGERTETMSIR